MGPPMPGPIRPQRVGDVIRAELGALLQREVRDPGARNVTVTHVRMTNDLQHARVYYTLLADGDARTARRALRRARPFLKRRLGRVGLRRVPELTFLHDDSAERQDRVARLLEEVGAARPPDPPDRGADDG